MEPGLLARLSDAAETTFIASPVLFAYVFGSVATGNDHPGSDLDIAVYLDPDANAAGDLELSLDLASRLAAAARIGDVDLLVLNNAPLRIAGRSIQQRVVIYTRDEPARVRFESDTTRQFLDFEIHARILDQELLRAMAEGRR